jgi:aminoglycoside N3'-acetyltransferase
MKIVQFLFYFSPKVIKNIATQMNQKRSITAAKVRLKVKVSKEYLAQVFDTIQIDSDVFVHSSLMHIGKIEGGYKEVVRLLNTKVLDNQHTLLFSALPFKGSSEEFLKGLSVFDISTAAVEMGVVNEYYSMLPNAERSLSPTHSVVAVGPAATDYTAFHHLSETPFDENSPYFKIAAKKGKILMFGAGLSHLTIIHVVEDLLGDDFPFRVYTKKRYQIELINKKGERSRGTFMAHDSFRGLFRDIEPLTKSLRTLPGTVIFPLGCSELILMDAREIIVYLLESLQSGNSAYGKMKLSKKAEDKINYWISYFKSL